MEFNGKVYKLVPGGDCSKCIFNSDIRGCNASPSCLSGHFKYDKNLPDQTVEQLLEEALTAYNKQYCTTLTSVYPSYSLEGEVLSLGITSESILK